MTPWRILQQNPKALSYFKVAIVGSILSIGVTLANNERLNQNKRATDKLVFYSINRAACGAYSLVDPTIKANKTLIESLNRVIADPRTTTKVLKLTKTRKKSVVHQLNVFQHYHDNYTTIPVNFDCRRLPKNPPA